MSDAVKYFQKNGLKRSKELVEMGFGFCSLEGGLSFHTEQLRQLVESHELIKKVDFWGRVNKGLMKARTVIENNTLQASYFQPSSGAYYRYGHNSIYVVRNNEWKEIYGGMDSNSLIHTDRLKQAIADVESCQGEIT